MLGRILSLFTALMLACAPASAYAPERSIAAPELRAWAPKTASREFAAAAKQAAKQNPAASVCRVWEIWSPPLKLASSMGFTGYYADAESGQYYAQQRYYRQGVGRFLSVDPWEGDTLSPITLNKYLYANGNPLRFIDPDGRRGCDSVQCTLLQARNLARTDDERARIDQLRATEVQVQAGKADAVEAFVVENVEATVELALDVGAATVEQSTGGLVNLGGKDRLAARGEALYDFATNDPLGQIERGLEGRAAEAQRLREAGDIRGATRVGFGTGLEVVSVAGGGVGAARGTLLAANRFVSRAPTGGDAVTISEGDGLTPTAANADEVMPSAACFGSASCFQYRETFFEQNPGLRGKVVVHHAVEQQTLTRYPDAVTPEEIHSLENLRGIPKALNNSVHLSQIRREWNKFYRGNPNPSKEDLLKKATEIDDKFGSQFDPPVR